MVSWGVVYVLPLVPLSYPSAAQTSERAAIVVKGFPDKDEKYVEATASTATFKEFHRILKGYPDLVMNPELVRNAGKTPEQFEKDVAAYVVKEDESGYIIQEEGDYDKLVLEMKLLHRAVGRISKKSEVLHDVLLRFARQSADSTGKC